MRDSYPALLSVAPLTGLLLAPIGGLARPSEEAGVSYTRVTRSIPAAKAAHSAQRSPACPVQYWPHSMTSPPFGPSVWPV